MTDPLHTRTTTLLTSWEALDPAQDLLRRAMLDQLGTEPDAMRRICRTGHLTGSALVVDHSWSHGLLHLHRRLARWLQMGGHTDDLDETLADTTLREATEESGIVGLRLAGAAPVDLDIHPLDCPAGHPNRHLDVRWLVVAPADAQPVTSAESLALRWFPLDALAVGDVDAVIGESVQRLARLAIERRP